MHIADIDNVVIVVTKADNNTMLVITRIPACPVNHDKRRYNITPQIFNKHGTNTPLTHPNFKLAAAG